MRIECSFGWQVLTLRWNVFLYGGTNKTSDLSACESLISVSLTTTMYSTRKVHVKYFRSFGYACPTLATQD